MECPSTMGSKKAGRTWFLLAFFLVICSFGCSPQKKQPQDWTLKTRSTATASPDLTVQINFLEQRLETRTRAFLDMAELAELYLQRGRLRRSLGDFEQSQIWADRSLTEFENNRALLVRADHLQMGHQFKKSLEIVDRVLEADIGNLKATVMGIRIKLSQGDGPSAQKRLKKLPETPLSSLLFLRGQVAESNGDRDKARKLYQHSIRTESDGTSKSESVRRRAILARFEIEQGNWDEANSLLDAASVVSVSQPLAEVLRSKTLAQKGQYSNAAALLRANFELYRDVTFLVRLGEVELQSGLKDQAKQTFTTAIQLLRSDSLGHERDLALSLYFVDPKANAAEIGELMTKELERRRDPETLRVQTIIQGK